MFKLFLIFSTTCAVGTVAKESIKISLYFEPLSPESKKFFTEQFLPTYRELNQIIDFELDLVPFGKAIISNNDTEDFTMKCTHGPKECEIIKDSACTFPILVSEVNNLTDFLYCLMNNNYEIRNSVENCATDYNVSFDRIDAWRQTNQVVDLVRSLEIKTKILSLPLTSVPTIVFNDRFDKGDNDMSQSNFKRALGKYVNVPNPASYCGLNHVLYIGGIIVNLMASKMLR